MQPAAPLELPPLADTGHSRESLLHALKHSVQLPSTEVAVATVYAEEIEPDVIAVLERARGEELDPPSQRLLFRGLHILAGRRLAAGYRPLIAFLRGPQERVDGVFGDAVTDSLSRIIAGMFDGDVEPLLALIMDPNAGEYVRHSAMGALTFLAFDGRVDRVLVGRFLARFEADHAAPAGDQAWDAWMAAVALLGLESMSERVGAAFRDGRIPSWMSTEADYRRILRAAIARPEDGERFARERLGYIADVLAELEGFSEDDPAIGSAEPDTASERLSWLPQEPAHNPWRGVGRNDPCPCGSGKKFKKCCLP